MSLVSSEEESSCSLTALSIPQIMNQLNNSISSYVSPRPSNIDLVDLEYLLLLTLFFLRNGEKMAQIALRMYSFLGRLESKDYALRYITQQWKEEISSMHRVLVTIIICVYADW